MRKTWSLLSSIFSAMLVAGIACSSSSAPTPGGTDVMQAIAERLGEDGLAESQAVTNPLDISLAEQDQALSPVPVNGDDPVWGPADAPVTLIVYSDFECPFCGRHAQNVAKVKEANGDLVRVVFKQFPLAFHQRAMPAAMASLAALEQGKFWQVHDRLFDRNPLSPEEMQEWADEAGIDWESVLANVGSDALRARVQRDIDEGGQFGVRGTPASFINGVSISGAVPLGDLQEKVDLGLARAYVLLRKGTAPADLYNRLVGIPAKRK
jgi:protein-disulfide isomerase